MNNSVVSLLPWLVIATALAGDGCVISEEGQLIINDSRVSYGGGLQPEDEKLVLAGTTLCPEVECNEGCVDGGINVDDCFARRVEGAAIEPQPGCIELVGSGRADWRFDPVPCALNERGYEPVEDGFSATVVPVDEVDARFFFQPEELVAKWVADGDALVWSPSATLPDDFVPRRTEPLHVLAETPVALQLGLTMSDDDRAVAFSVDDSSVTGATPTETGAISPLLELAAGEEVDITLKVQDQSWPVGHAVGRSPSEISALELVAFKLVDSSSDAVFNVRAIPRDEAGRPVFGVPVTWEVIKDALSVESLGMTPRLPSTSSEGTLAVDWIALRDICVLPSDRRGERTATIAARFGEVSATLDLQWTGSAPLGESDRLFVLEDSCRGPRQDDAPTCGCSSSRSSEHSLPMAGLLALAVVGAGLRRRGSPRRIEP